MRTYQLLDHSTFASFGFPSNWVDQHPTMPAAPGAAAPGGCRCLCSRGRSHPSTRYQGALLGQRAEVCMVCLCRMFKKTFHRSGPAAPYGWMALLPR